MRKRQYRHGSSIREAKPSNYDGETVAAPDMIMADLHMSLSPEFSRRIWELDWNGVPRSQFARQVGIPKTRVVHELISLDMKDTPSSKYAPKSYERSSTL
jgi:hypothetical protein